MLEIPRRQLITGLVSFIAAPAIVRATSIMPVRSLARLELGDINNSAYDPEIIEIRYIIIRLDLRSGKAVFSINPDQPDRLGPSARA
jgi:hypothetical protein